MLVFGRWLAKFLYMSIFNSARSCSSVNARKRIVGLKSCVSIVLPYMYIVVIVVIVIV